MAKGDPRLKAARATRDELVRQLVLERRHDYVMVPQGNTWVVPAAVERAMQGFQFGFVAHEAFNSLVSAADRVVARVDGLVVNVVAIDVVKDAAPLTDRLTLAEIVTIATSFRELTGSINMTKIPVTFQIVVIFAQGIPEDFKARALEFERRGVVAPKVGVGVVALDAATGEVWSNFPGLVRLSHQRLVARAWREREMTRDARAALLANAGFKLDRALLGAGSGVLLGAAATYGLLAAGAKDGKFYGGVVIMASALAAAISVKTCRISESTIAQAAVGGVVGAVGCLAAGALLGVGIGFGSLLVLAVAALVSVMVGAAENPSGRAAKQ